MRWGIIFLLMNLVQLQVQAQPGSKGKIYPIQVYLEASREVPPFADELFSQLLESREQLEAINASPSAKGYGTIKAIYYTYAIQSLILSHRISVLQAYSSDKDLFVQYFKEFYLFETDDIEWKHEKKQARQLLDYYMQMELSVYKKNERSSEFLENQENRVWYETTIGEFDLNQLLDSVYLEQDFDAKLNLLKNTTIDVESFCGSTYSRTKCSIIDDYILTIEGRIQEKKEIDSINYVKRELKIKARQKEIESAIVMVEKADSLFDLGLLLEAKDLYEATKTIRFNGNRSINRINEIKTALVNKEENRFKANIYNTFLFDSLGRLRIDTTKSIQPLELKQIRDNRELISAQIISALQDYESYLMEYEFEKSQYDVFELLPYQIKDTTVHLYTITCDSSGLLTVEHKLLSNNLLYGSNSDSIIQKAIPSIFSYLKINDGAIHKYLIPIIYIPSRHKRLKTVSYYCNCHFVGKANIDYINLSCKDYQNQKNTNHDPFHVSSMKNEMNSSLDEFYFVISDGYPWSLGPNPVAPVKEIIPPQEPRKKKKRTTKNKQH